MTREEAIKELRGFIGQLTEGCQEAIKVLIPELTESEDEKIIRLLRELGSLDTAEELYEEFNLSYTDVLYWLEKQKEQNGEDEKCTDFTIYHPLKNGKGEYECIPYSFYGSLTSFSEGKDLIDFLRTCFYTEEECNEWIKQQQEQKPVPFSCGHENDKPAEWSAEDEEMLDYVISDVNDAKELFATKEAIDLCDEEIAWLKSLRPSWKPSEEQMDCYEKQR